MHSDCFHAAALNCLAEPRMMVTDMIAERALQPSAELT
jgi:hypothetical protein